MATREARVGGRAAEGRQLHPDPGYQPDREDLDAVVHNLGQHAAAQRGQAGPGSLVVLTLGV